MRSRGNIPSVRRIDEGDRREHVDCATERARTGRSFYSPFLFSPSFVYMYISPPGVDAISRPRSESYRSRPWDIRPIEWNFSFPMKSDGRLARRDNSHAARTRETEKPLITVARERRATSDLWSRAPSPVSRCDTLKSCRRDK